MTLGVAAALGAVAAGAPALALRPWLRAAGYRYPDEVDVRRRPTEWVLPVAVAVGGLVGAALAGRPVLTAPYAVFAAVLLVLTAIDLDVHRLPNAWTLPMLVVVPVGLLAATWMEGTGLSDWIRAVLAGVGVGGFFLLLALLGGGSGMGLGDVKLAPSLGMALGYLSLGHVVVGLLVSFLTGGFAAVVLLLRGRSRRSHFAFGPFLMTGTVTALVTPLLVRILT